MMTAVCIGILVLLPLADLGVKYMIEKHVSGKEEIPVCKGRILIRYVQNKGMALNLLERYPSLVRWGSVLAIIPMAGYLLYLSCQSGRRLEKISLSMILGGAVSNLYDRFVRKYVVDYFGFRSRWKKMEEVTYNLGDMGIFAGAAGVVLCSLFRRK